MWSGGAEPSTVPLQPPHLQHLPPYKGVLVSPGTRLQQMAGRCKPGQCPVYCPPRHLAIIVQLIDLSAGRHIVRTHLIYFYVHTNPDSFYNNCVRRKTSLYLHVCAPIQSPVELETKVVRKFPKILQSWRPRLALSPC